MIVRSDFLCKCFSWWFKVSGIALWPFAIVKKDAAPAIVRHELIHLEQYKDLWIIGMPFVAIWDFTKGYIKYKDCMEAYRRCRIEQEAYTNQSDPDYIKNRKRFAWLNYKV